MKKVCIPLLAIVMMLSACTIGHQSLSGYTKYTYEFLGTFDTVVQFMGYAKGEDDFETMAKLGESRFLELHKLFDIYNDYEGINNIKTINDNAGIKPVEVKQEIIDLILFSKEWYDKTGGIANIALGPVLRIWHDYREAGIADPAHAEVPPMAALKEANQFTDIHQVIVDTERKTVYLSDPHMLLDVGSVAKGYATEIVCDELVQKGYTSFIISSGGNVKVIGKPLDGTRSKWGIGIQNPDGDPLNPDDTPLDTVFLNVGSVVTSGDYQRFYTVNGQIYHHLIDPKTLMPGTHYRSVSVMAEDSGLCDFMSSTLFLLPLKEAKALAERLGVEAFWILQDGSYEATEAMKASMKKLGGATN